jgi:hypothetical protein
MIDEARRLERQRLYRINNREKIKVSQSNYHQKNKDEIIARHICKRRNITVDEYRQMFVDQDNKCAICGQNETRMNVKKTEVLKLCVDHDPISGKVRALLCYSCNLGLGLFKEDAALVEQALKYITAHRDRLNDNDSRRNPDTC